jgi:mRNA-degrading endonuclease toxin of MazEF toxin-antitoxin module
MLKKFKNWIQQKFRTHQYDKRPFYNQRDIWWCQFGQNVGDEENGKGDKFMRPVVVLKKFNQNICLVAPTSTKLKDNKYYFEIEYNNQKYSVLISQIRTMDTKRFRKRIARLSKFELNEIKKAISVTILDQKIDLQKEVRD